MDRNCSRVTNFDHVYSKEVNTFLAKDSTHELKSHDMSQPRCSNLLQCPTQAREMITDPTLLNKLSPVLEIEIPSQSPIDNILSPGEHDITTPTVPKEKKSCRTRIIQTINKLTPTCKKLYKEFAKANKQADFHCRVKQAIKFTKENCFEKMAKNMNRYAKEFVKMQINLCMKKKKGRRFNLEEKLISLAIMKQSPKCYRFLHKIFILPSTSTLNKMVSNLNIEAGINKEFFALLKREVDTWPDSKKHCSIIFGEMLLSTGLSYDIKKDQINGFVHLNKRKRRFADHVLVFMARGVVHKWQQPISYYFCEEATSGPELIKILKEIVPAVAETGLNPLVLGCHQGTAFQSAIKSLQQDTSQYQLLQNQEPDNTVIIGVSKLNVIYDPSHLIKGIRNNFLTKDIKYKEKTSRWQDIVDVYNIDCNDTETRLLYKLNDEHVIPNKVKKMKVVEDGLYYA